LYYNVCLIFNNEILLFKVNTKSCDMYKITFIIFIIDIKFYFDYYTMIVVNIYKFVNKLHIFIYINNIFIIIHDILFFISYLLIYFNLIFIKNLIKILYNFLYCE